MTRPGFGLLAALLAGTFVGCGSDDDSSNPPPGGDAQNPPMGRAAVEAWLSANHYKSWRCESAPHAARSPSPHGINRICSNNLLSQHGAGEYPVGSAAVKELLDASNNIIGYAVYRHTRAGTTGDTWYWYERIPASTPTSQVPHDGNGIVADGMGGGTGPEETICVGCHQGAGSDAAHSGHDFVYTQVK